MDTESPGPASTQPTEQGTRGALFLWAIPLLLAYVLSPGPAYKALGTRSLNTLTAIYSPLIYLDEHIPAVHTFYRWYFAVWRV
jgi:hypothetical protein